jgi:hypothetical protein
MRARGVPTRRDVNADDHFVRTKRMFKMRRRSRQPVQVSEKEAPIARAASNVENCVQRDKRHRHVGRVRSNAVLAGAEDRMPAVLAISCGASGSWFSLIAGAAGIAEVSAAGSLHQVPTNRGHVTKLHGGAREKRLRDHRICGRNRTIGRHVGHACERADLKPMRHYLDAPMGKAVDIDERSWLLDLFAHEIDQRGPAGEKSRAAGGGLDSGDIVWRAIELKREHGYIFLATLPMAAMMAG